MKKMSIKALEAILPRKYPRNSLNYIYIDDDYIVATDSIILLAIPKPEYISYSKCFIDNPKVKDMKVRKYTLSKDEVVGEYDEKTVFKNYQIPYVNWKYVTYTFEKEYKYKFEVKESTIFTLLYEITRDYKFVFDYENIMDKLKKIQKYIKSNIKYVSFSDPHSPVEIEYQDGTLLLIMPYLLNINVLKSFEKDEKWF